MNWGERFRFRLQVFVAFLAVMSPGFLIWMAPQAKRQIESYQWPKTTGVVESTTAKVSMDDKNVAKYVGRVVYQYSVDGRDYTSDLADLGPGAKRDDERTALADVNAYRAGRSVVVYYDPNDPSVAVVENGIPSNHLIVLIAMAIGTVVCIPVAFFVVRSWLRALRGSKTAESS